MDLSTAETHVLAAGATRNVRVDQPLSPEVKVQKFSYRFTLLKKLNYIAVLNVFTAKVNFVQTPVWPMLYMYKFRYRFTFSQAQQPPLLRCRPQQTDRQYGYYAKNFNRCLSSEIISTCWSISCSVFQNTQLKDHLAH